MAEVIDRARSFVDSARNAAAEHLPDLEAAIIHVVGTCIEIFGVFIIVAAIIWSTFLYLHRREEKLHYDQYKIRIGRSLLLGLELLTAGDRMVAGGSCASAFSPGGRP